MKLRGISKEKNCYSINDSSNKEHNITYITLIERANQIDATDYQDIYSYQL